MKKRLCLVGLCLLAFCFAGCGGKPGMLSSGNVVYLDEDPGQEYATVTAYGGVEYKMPHGWTENCMTDYDSAVSALTDYFDQFSEDGTLPEDAVVPEQTLDFSAGNGTDLVNYRDQFYFMLEPIATDVSLTDCSVDTIKSLLAKQLDGLNYTPAETYSSQSADGIVKVIMPITMQNALREEQPGAVSFIQNSNGDTVMMLLSMKNWDQAVADTVVKSLRLTGAAVDAPYYFNDEEAASEIEIEGESALE